MLSMRSELDHNYFRYIWVVQKNMDINQQIKKKKYTTIIYGSTMRDDLHRKAQLFTEL